MDENTKKKGKRVTFEWTKAEEEAFDTLSTREPFSILGSSRRAIMRYLIITAAQEADEKPVNRQDLEDMINKVRGSIIVQAQAAPAVPQTPAKRGPKPKEPQPIMDERIEEGSGICDALGGSISGFSCTYKKYEVMATGRPVAFDVTEPLASLTMGHLNLQFDPSREGYERAVADWKDTE